MNEDELSAGLAPTPSYRYADVVGNELFVAGQVPLDGGGELGRCLAIQQPRRRQCLAQSGHTPDFGTMRFSIGSDIRHLTIYVVGEHQNLARRLGRDDVRGGVDEVPPATLLGA